MTESIPQSAMAFAQSTSTTRRTFQVEEFQVTHVINEQGAAQWTCHCEDFKHLLGQGAHCFHVAIAIDQAMEETADKIGWHTQHRVASR
jgi:hypothetical protein